MKRDVSIPERIYRLPVSATKRSMAIENYFAAEASVDRLARAAKLASQFVALVRVGFAPRHRST
jgi:hypothetical protein